MGTTPARQLASSPLAAATLEVILVAVSSKVARRQWAAPMAARALRALQPQPQLSESLPGPGAAWAAGAAGPQGGVALLDAGVLAPRVWASGRAPAESRPAPTSLLDQAGPAGRRAGPRAGMRLAR